LGEVANADQERLRQGAYTRMYQSGAHYVVDSITDIMPASTTSKRASRAASDPRSRRRAQSGPHSDLLVDSALGLV